MWVFLVLIVVRLQHWNLCVMKLQSKHFLSINTKPALIDVFCVNKGGNAVHTA
jgi:hypothetical protein